jgi:hypothetical protein
MGDSFRRPSVQRVHSKIDALSTNNPTRVIGVLGWVIESLAALPPANRHIRLDMPLALSPAVASRLEKAEEDNGFECELPAAGEWLAFAVTQSPLCMWLGATSGGAFAVALSQHNVAVALGTLGEGLEQGLPARAPGTRGALDIPTLNRLIRRALQLRKSPPDEPLHVFVAQTATLPRTTIAERLVIQRIGQEIFPQGLLAYWKGYCALHASHIKPWAACESDAESLDVYNGLLLAPNLDTAFEHGFITVTDSGEVIVSSELEASARQLIGLALPQAMTGGLDRHRASLQWHQEGGFESGKHARGDSPTDCITGSIQRATTVHKVTPP